MRGSISSPLRIFHHTTLHFSHRSDIKDILESAVMSSILKSSMMVFTALFVTITSATPLPGMSRRIADYNPLTPRAPITAAAFSDWPTNVVMLGGSQQFGMWVPPDGTWYNLCKIQCLDLPAYATGPCCSPTIDNIGVAAGNGPCSFVGWNGFSATISGASGSGYYTVGPPQTLVSAACG